MAPSLVRRTKSVTCEHPRSSESQARSGGAGPPFIFFADTTTTEAAAPFAVFERCALHQPTLGGFPFIPLSGNSDRGARLVRIAAQTEPQISTRLIHSSGPKLGHTFPQALLRHGNCIAQVHCEGAFHPVLFIQLPGTTRDDTPRIVEVSRRNRDCRYNASLSLQIVDFRHTKAGPKRLAMEYP